MLSETEKYDKRGLNSLILRLLGLAAMTVDYVYTYLIEGRFWVMNLEWFAFPIFAFLLAEGFQKTSDKRLYLRRLIVFAIISEFPYDYLNSARAFSMERQSVMLTLLIGYLCMWLVSIIREKAGNVALTGISAAVICFIGTFAATRMNAYMGRYGIIIIMIFHIALNVTYSRLFELGAFMVLVLTIASDYMSTKPMGGYIYRVPSQIFALLALIPIALYDGKRGPNTRPLKIAYYAAYPIITLVIALLFMRSTGL